MTHAELLSIIGSQDIYVYPVIISAENKDREHVLFDGDLNSFLAAAKHATRHVFISRYRFDKDDFIYEIEPDTEDTDEELVEIDLCTVVKGLSKYKEHIDEDAQFMLWFEVGSEKIIFIHNEPWWTEFTEQREAAIERIEDDREAMAQKAIEQREANEAALLKNLRGLAADQDFVRLPSQMAMKEYAMAKFPDLEDVDQRRLQTEIQSLNAQIQAKGLGRGKKGK